MSSDVTDVWQCDCDITLNPDPSFEEKVKKKIKVKKESWKKLESKLCKSDYCQSWNARAVEIVLQTLQT